MPFEFAKVRKDLRRLAEQDWRKDEAEESRRRKGKMRPKKEEEEKLVLIDYCHGLWNKCAKQLFKTKSKSQT